MLLDQSAGRMDMRWKSGFVCLCACTASAMGFVRLEGVDVGDETGADRSSSPRTDPCGTGSMNGIGISVGQCDSCGMLQFVALFVQTKTRHEKPRTLLLPPICWQHLPAGKARRILSPMLLTKGLGAADSSEQAMCRDSLGV